MPGPADWLPPIRAVEGAAEAATLVARRFRRATIVAVIAVLCAALVLCSLLIAGGPVTAVLLFVPFAGGALFDCVRWYRRADAVERTGWRTATVTLGPMGPRLSPVPVAVKFADGSRIRLRSRPGLLRASPDGTAGPARGGRRGRLRVHGPDPAEAAVAGSAEADGRVGRDLPVVAGPAAAVVTFGPVPLRA
jgi:hypothetical protein